jgi:uncharacterized membrane protein YfcA
MFGEFAVTTVAACAAVIFVAFIVRGMSGFGAGLVAIPLLVFLIPVHVAVPMSGLLVFFLFVYLFIRDWREVVWRELRLLALPTVLGVVAGMSVHIARQPMAAHAAGRLPADLCDLHVAGARIRRA